MKAAEFYDRKGGPEVLRYGELPDRVPGPGELRVRGCVSAINSANAVTLPDDIPLDLVAEAHPRLRTAGVGGKILLDIA
jgi:NADPH:quinone reductase-like Zn-dependent oxidoreductase